jgi:hypothetical protein
MRRFSRVRAGFWPIDKVSTPSYLSVISSQARPAGCFLLRIAEGPKSALLTAHPAPP